MSAKFPLGPLAHKWPGHCLISDNSWRKSATGYNRYNSSATRLSWWITAYFDQKLFQEYQYILNDDSLRLRTASDDLAEAQWAYTGGTADVDLDV